MLYRRFSQIPKPSRVCRRRSRPPPPLPIQKSAHEHALSSQTRSCYPPHRRGTYDPACVPAGNLPANKFTGFFSPRHKENQLQPALRKNTKMRTGNTLRLSASRFSLTRKRLFKRMLPACEEMKTRFCGFFRGTGAPAGARGNGRPVQLEGSPGRRGEKAFLPSWERAEDTLTPPCQTTKALIVQIRREDTQGDGMPSQEAVRYMSKVHTHTAHHTHEQTNKKQILKDKITRTHTPPSSAFVFLSISQSVSLSAFISCPLYPCFFLSVGFQFNFIQHAIWA